MHRAHKIALDPTCKQSTGLAKAAGTARFAYNWALSMRTGRKIRPCPHHRNLRYGGS